MVLNSDSDSDELEVFEISFLKKSTASNNTKSAVKSRGTPSSYLTPYRRVQDDDLRRPTYKPRTANSALNRLVQAAKVDSATEEKIALGKVDLDRPLEGEASAQSLGGGFLDEEALLRAGGNEEDKEKARRVMNAVHRTNVGNTDCVFHFFAQEPASTSYQPLSFPVKSLPDHGWVSNLEDPERRDMAFSSGFASQIFQYQELPEELALWMIDQICIGRKSGLTAKYLELLECHHQHVERIGAERVEKMFRDLGANMDFLNLLQEVVPSIELRGASKKKLPSSLKSVTLLLQSISKWLSPEASNQALLILVHLCFDDSVMADISTLIDVQQTIEAIIGSIEDLTPILNNLIPPLVSRITNPILQRNLLLSLPAKSALTASLRRHLALAFLLHPSPLKVSLDSPKILPMIHKLLESSPHFVIRNKRGTDYKAFAARLVLLDIGIGPGLGVVPYPRPVAPEEIQISKARGLTAEDIAFNHQVDDLARHVRLVGNQIVEAGALTDITILEAKDASEKLFHRLENAVRIGGIKKRVFIAEEEASEASRNVFLNWVKKPGNDDGNCGGSEGDV